MENRRNLLVTLADSNYIQHAKQLFSSVYWNAGWHGDYMLLSHEIPEEGLEWFSDKGILIKKCIPLYNKEIGIEKYSPVVLDKFYLFTKEFKKWKNIVFLDADIIVRASLNPLTKVKNFASVNVMGDKLKLFFNAEANPEAYQILADRYDMNSMAFNSGVMSFNTAIIEDGTFDKLINTFKSHLDIISGDDPVLNLCFFKRWEKLPAVYDISPKTVEKYTGIDAESVQGVVIHLKGKELADKGGKLYNEWKKNFEKADLININQFQKCVTWSFLKIKSYTNYIDIRFKFHSTFLYFKNSPERIAGKTGGLLKKLKPSWYKKIKRIIEPYPSIFIIEITNTCIARCHQCDMWKNSAPQNEISTKEKIGLIDEILREKRNSDLYIHFSGGEPFTKKDEVLKLAEYCKQKNVICGVDTTGYLIGEKLAGQITQTGLIVYISLDSLDPETHNNMRRLENCHQRAMMAIDNLIKYGGRKNIVLVCVLTKKNLHEVDKIIRFAHEKDVRLTFQPLMFNPIKNPEYLQAEYWPDNIEQINSALNNIRNMKKQGYKISVSLKKIFQIKEYFKTGSPQIKCTYFRKKLSVDSYGDVRLCFFSEPVGNIRDKSLIEIYYSPEVRKMKKKLAKCSNRSCNLPVCQDADDQKIKYLKEIFVYSVSLPDKILGNFGVFLKKHTPGLYKKIKNL